MRILLVGAGGVGSAFCAIAVRREFFEQIVVCDYDESRARQAADAVGDSRFSAAQVDATSADDVAELVRRHDITHVMNAVDPRFVMPIFNGALAGGADYLDMAMSLSLRHLEQPYQLTGVKLGDEQFAVEDQWRSAGRLALVGIGVEPGLSDVFARYAADHLFSDIDELAAIKKELSPKLGTGALHLLKHLEAQRDLDLKWLQGLHADVAADRVYDSPVYSGKRRRTVRS